MNEEVVETEELRHWTYTVAFWNGKGSISSAVVVLDFSIRTPEDFFRLTKRLAMHYGVGEVAIISFQPLLNDHPADEDLVEIKKRVYSEEQLRFDNTGQAFPDLSIRRRIDRRRGGHPR